MEIQEITKCFSAEFKQKAIDYALSNSHESVDAVAQKLSADYSRLDKWIREVNPAGSSKRQFSLEQQRILELEKEANDTFIKTGNFLFFKKNGRSSLN